MTKKATFTLGAGKQLAYENELRGRLGLLPKGAAVPIDVRIWGWAVTILYGVIAAFTRLFNLRHPHALIFDETYYVKGAFSMLNYGYERDWTGDDVNDLFLAGDLAALEESGLEDKPDRWVHPPFGKWIMGVGMRLFGDDNGLGWRFTTAILGVLAVMLVVRIALRLFNSVPLAVVAGTAMTFDGMGIVLSRTGILDNILAFFVLVGFWALLKDRDYSRSRLAEQVSRGKLYFDDGGTAGQALPQAGQLSPYTDHPLPKPGRPLRPADPWAVRLWMRPWLLVAGVVLGLATATKWSGGYAIAVFGLFAFAWGTSARKAVGARNWFGAGVFREGIPAFVWFVPTAVLSYLAGWIPWFANELGYDRMWAQEQQARNAQLPPADQIPMPIEGAPDVVNSFVHYHQATMEFHTGLSEPHTYQSDAWAWLIQFRPVSFFWRGSEDVAAQYPGACEGDCVAAITSVGNPFVWWLAVVALVIVVWAAIRRRDWRAWAILAGYLAMYLPWFIYYDRTIYQFYSIAFLPFVVLALTYAVGWLADLLPAARTQARTVAEIWPALEAGALAKDNPIVGEPGRHEMLPGTVAVPIRDKSVKIFLGVLIGVIVVAAIFWMPLWWGNPIPRWFWQIHMWLPSWI